MDWLMLAGAVWLFWPKASEQVDVTVGPAVMPVQFNLPPFLTAGGGPGDALEHPDGGDMITNFDLPPGAEININEALRTGVISSQQALCLSLLSQGLPVDGNDRDLIIDALDRMHEAGYSDSPFFFNN